MRKGPGQNGRHVDVNKASMTGRQNDALKCPSNQHFSMAMKHWCELACNSLRKALQIHA
jgi:hypothetical protein